MIDYVVAEETATLVWLANLAALELHVPQWTIGSGRVGPDGVLDLPGEEPADGEPLADRVVVDLDPGAGMDVLDSAHAALLVAGVMAGDGLVPVPQTSGSKGVQVYAAVAPVPRPRRVGVREGAQRRHGAGLGPTSSSRRCRSSSGAAGSTSTTTRTCRPATPSRPTRCAAANAPRSPRR